MKEHIRDFLNTGLLEQYVLGLTDEFETQTVEAYIQDFPEVREIYEQIQDGMENLAKVSAMSVPPSVKTSVMQAIDDNIPHDAPLKSQPSFWLPLAAVTAILLGVFSFYQSGTIDSKNQQIAELKTEFATLKQDCESKNLRFADIQSRLDFINAPGTEKYLLEGNAKATDFQTIAYWNNNSQKSMLQILGLPDLPEKRCFQMWADVDGVMINLGVIKSEQTTLPIDWKFLANAESLNVTIEPEGGSDHPTVSDLVASISI